MTAKAARPKPRRQIQADRSRDDVLWAAARVLGRSGYGPVSMHDIAHEMGVTAPALYGYFESKEEIFSELARRLERGSLEAFEMPVPATLPFRQRLAIVLRRQLEWTDHNRDVIIGFFQLMMRGETGWMVQKGQQRPRVGHVEHARHLARWLKRQVGPSDLSGNDTTEAAFALVGISHGFFLRWICSPAGGRLADYTDRMLDLFFHGMLGPKGHRGKAS